MTEKLLLSLTVLSALGSFAFSDPFYNSAPPAN